ncbi:putative saccharopine dehydrogenase, NADP binding domain, NAD(P)-binding domain superfamily [Helianthus annuus]|nr:putative saccharopine dehydrogenase, NADP binding domain, NAD(P)-binding domain superfamily [Helianthus annuus]
MAEVQQPAYDMIIFGATGFAGKYIIREALKFLGTQNSPLKTLALAGRSYSKLSEALKWASSSTSHSTIPLLIADTSDPHSLLHMASKAKLVLNCVGPFLLHGDPVVAACVEAGCDYLDICAETEFMETMEVVYHEKAVKKGSLVVSACGFDSIPAELGYFFNSRQWVSPAVPNQVEAYLSLESEKKVVVNFGTLESLVWREVYDNKLVELHGLRPKRTLPQIPGSEGSPIEHQKKIGLWAMKLPSADATVVRRTLSMLIDNPTGLQGVDETPKQAEKRVAYWSKIKLVHFGVKIATKSLIGILIIIASRLSIGLLGRFTIWMWLLINFPAVFSLGVFRKNGPTKDEIASAGFKMWFVSRGSSGANKKLDTEIITRVMGPDIAYVTTSIIFVQCALTVLRQRGDLPKGGVFPPGFVFGPTDLQDRLQDNGVSFDVISKGDIST